MQLSRIWNSPPVLVLRNTLWTLLLPGVIAGYIPWRFFGFRVGEIALGSGAYLLGIVVFAAGVLVLLWCILEFARRGRGTLSPVDPARELVVTGLYRQVRNPMYVGVVTILVGEAVMARSLYLALYATAFFACANLFILVYEEPYLQRTFGSSYTHYKLHVRRWIPRASPWSQSEHREPGAHDLTIG